MGFLATSFPGGLEAGTTYYVLADGLTADAFKVAAKKSGAAIDIASAGSGLYVTYGGAYPTTLKMVNTIYGTVTDDDGALSKLEASLDHSSWTELALSGGTWSWEISTEDGPKDLYFRATDAKGATYMDEVRIVRRTAPATSYVAAPVAFKIDRVPPEIGSAIYVDKTSAYDFADQVELKSDTGVFGGPTNAFRLKASATDANGIKSVRLDITGKDVAAPASSKTVSYPATLLSGSDYATGDIDLGASFADGSASAVVYVTDNSGLVSSATRSIIIDNTAPSISVISPANAEVVNGEVTVRGLANDGSGSGLASLTYRLGKNYASKSALAVDDISVPSIAFLSNNGPGGANNKIDTYASFLSGKADRVAGEERSFAAATLAGNNDIAVGNGIKVNGYYRTISGWTKSTGRIEWSGDAVAVGANQDYEVYTDIQTVHDASTGADLFVLPFVLKATDNAGNVVETAPVSGSSAARPSTTSLSHASLVNNSLVAIGQLVFVGDTARIVTSYAAATGAIGWSGAVDAGATSFTLYPYCLRIDPNGDKPVAAIGYPESNKVYGGKIRVYGTAIDDDGVSQVYMQIDCDNDGDFDAADAAGGIDWFNNGLGQLVDGSVNWNKTINASKEFDPAGDTPNVISIRVRAKDVYGTYGPWSAARSFSIDKNVPKIGSAYSLKLDPDADPNNGNEIPYEYGMYLTGTWYLRGSIETETALNGIELTGDIAKSITWSGSAYAGDTGAFSFVTPGTGANADKYRRIDLNVQIACPDDTADPLDFELYAEDVREPALSSAQTMRINVDTRAPTAPTGPSYSLASPVKQVDYWAKIGGTANDVGSDVDRVEVYLVRRNKDGTASLDRFYNLLASNTYTARGASLFSYAETGAYAYVPRVASSATSRPSTTSLVDTAIAGNAMINVGQKIVIGGQTLTISSWDRGSGAVSWTGGTVETSVTSYYVDVAIRIDHKDSGVPESHRRLGRRRGRERRRRRRLRGVPQADLGHDLQLVRRRQLAQRPGWPRGDPLRRLRQGRQPPPQRRLDQGVQQPDDPELGHARQRPRRRRELRRGLERRDRRLRALGKRRDRDGLQGEGRARQDRHRHLRRQRPAGLSHHVRRDANPSRRPPRIRLAPKRLPQPRLPQGLGRGREGPRHADLGRHRGDGEQRYRGLLRSGDLVARLLDEPERDRELQLRGQRHGLGPADGLHRRPRRPRLGLEPYRGAGRHRRRRSGRLGAGLLHGLRLRRPGRLGPLGAHRRLRLPARLRDPRDEDLRRRDRGDLAERGDLHRRGPRPRRRRYRGLHLDDGHHGHHERPNIFRRQRRGEQLPSRREPRRRRHLCLGRERHRLQLALLPRRLLRRGRLGADGLHQARERLRGPDRRLRRGRLDLLGLVLELLAGGPRRDMAPRLEQREAVLRGHARPGPQGSGRGPGIAGQRGAPDDDHPGRRIPVGQGDTLRHRDPRRLDLDLRDCLRRRERGHAERRRRRRLYGLLAP